MKLKSIPLIFECYNFTLYLIKCTPPYFKETKSVKKNTQLVPTFSNSLANFLVTL